MSSIVERCVSRFESAAESRLSWLSLPLQANVICIVYAVNNKKSIEKVSLAIVLEVLYAHYVMISASSYSCLLFCNVVSSPSCFPLGDQPLDSTYK